MYWFYRQAINLSMHFQESQSRSIIYPGHFRKKYFVLLKHLSISQKLKSLKYLHMKQTTSERVSYLYKYRWIWYENLCLRWKNEIHMPILQHLLSISHNGVYRCIIPSNWYFLLYYMYFPKILLFQTIFLRLFTVNIDYYEWKRDSIGKAFIGFLFDVYLR